MKRRTTTLNNKKTLRRRKPRRKAPRSSKPPRNNNRARDTDIFSKLESITKSTVTNSATIVIMFTTIVVYLSSLKNGEFDIQSGPLADIISKNSSNSVVKWILAHPKKLIGLGAFGSLIPSIPSARRAIFVAASALWIYLIPQAKAFEYFIQAFCSLLFFKTNNTMVKFVAVMFSISIYLMGFVVLKK